MGLLEDLFTATMESPRGKEWLDAQRKASAEAAKPKPRDYEREALLEQGRAFGAHLLDGLPISPVKSAAARREEDERAAEIAKGKAEAATIAVEKAKLEEQVAEAERVARIREVQGRMATIAADREARGKKKLNASALRARALKSLAKGST